MAKRILRSFLYLDEGIVDDYLAHYENGILEGLYTIKDTNTGSKEGGGELKVGILGGNGRGTSSSSSEVSQAFREIPVVKFNRLYEHLVKDGSIQNLNGLDESIYEQVELGEIVQVRGNAKLPRWEHLSKVVSDLSSLADVMKAVGQDPFALAGADATQAIQGFSTLAAKKAQEDTDLIVASIGSPDFKFVAKLYTTRVLRRKEEFEAEVTILGKVLRKLAKGETIDIFRITPRLNQFENLNRVQRRSASKGKLKVPSTDTPLDEVIKYPAMQIQAIAVYQ